MQTKAQVGKLLVAAVIFVFGIAAGALLIYWHQAGARTTMTPSPTSEVQMAPGNASGQGGSMENMPGMDQGKEKGQRKILYWYDAMNPGHHYDKPGKAPDGMDLVPKYAGEEAGAVSMQDMAPGSVMLNSAMQQLIGVRYTEVRRAHMERTVRTVGLLQMNDEKISRIHVKIAGWIQKVYLNFVGKLVKEGQPLFTLYSPDLVSTEQEYLIALKGQEYMSKAPYTDAATGANALLDATRQRLQLWDITDAQISDLEKTGKVSQVMTLYSPTNGFVMTRNAFEQTYVTPETELYDIADLSTIWVYVDIFEYEAPYVHVGQPASMQLSYFPGKTYRGKVTYVYPTLDPKTRTIKARLEFPNPNYELKPDMYADVQLKVDYGVQTLVPSEAVLNSGTRQIVFIAKADGYFEPREIKVGKQFDDQYEVLAGLKPGEKIVASGNFLIDSESQLQAALGSFTPPPTPAPTAGTPQPQAQIQFSTEPSPPAKGTNTFRVRLTDVQGAGIAGAAVQVTFFMPGMPSMGMPPMRIESNLSDGGEGHYQGSGGLPSGGTWQVTVVARRDGQTIATQRLAVTATGGM
jgi:RND family efflux transporter MFP subunit